MISLVRMVDNGVLSLLRIRIFIENMKDRSMIKRIKWVDRAKLFYVIFGAMRSHAYQPNNMIAEIRSLIQGKDTEITPF